MVETNFILDCMLSSCAILHIFNLKTKMSRFIKSDNPAIPLNTELTLKELIEYQFDTDNPVHIEYSFKEFIEKGYDKLCTSSLNNFPKDNAHLNIREIVNGKIQWVRMSMLIPSNYSSDNPEILICGVNCTENECKYYDSQMALEESLLILAQISIPNNSIHIFKKQLTRDYISIPYNGSLLEKWFESFKEEHIFQDDWAIFEEYTNFDFLTNYFKYNYGQINFFYRQRISNVFTWVKARFVKSFDYNTENPTLIFTVENINTEVLRNIALSSRYQYELLMERKHKNISEVFYDDILSLMNLLTQPYLFYISIDLEVDAYLSFKTNNIFHNPYSSNTLSFSSTIAQYVNHFYTGEAAAQILEFTSIENIKKQLTDNATMRLKFIDKNGKPLIALISKTHAQNGIPTKALMTITVDTNAEDKLKIKTFGNFDVFNTDGTPFKFEKRASKEVLAYLIDKRGYPITINDIIIDILEKNTEDLNAKKYASALIRKLVKDLSNAGYPSVIVENKRTYRIDMNEVNCDYYHLLDGDVSYWENYNNEYMKEYSWAEETNSELLGAHVN